MTNEKSEDRRKAAKLEEMAEWTRATSRWNPLYILLLVILLGVAVYFSPDKVSASAISSLITVIVTRLLDERATTIGFYFGSSKKQKD